MTQNQISIFFVYFIAGIIICIIFDFFRSLRKSIKTANIVTYIEDILFWIIAGILLIIIISKFSYGELRLYIPVAIVVGGACYYASVSKFLVRANVKVINFIKKIISFIINTVFKILGKPIYFFIINMKKISKKSKKIKK